MRRIFSENDSHMIDISAIRIMHWEYSLSGWVGLGACHQLLHLTERKGVCHLECFTYKQVSLIQYIHRTNTLHNGYLDLQVPCLCRYSPAGTPCKFRFCTQVLKMIFHNFFFWEAFQQKFFSTSATIPSRSSQFSQIHRGKNYNPSDLISCKSHNQWHQMSCGYRAVHFSILCVCPCRLSSFTGKSSGMYLSHLFKVNLKTKRRRTRPT